MPVASTVTVSATATVVVVPNGAAADLEWVKVKNTAGAAATVYIGGSAVTTTAGFPVEAGASEVFGLRSGETLYGIVASGTQVVNLLKARNS